MARLLAITKKLSCLSSYPSSLRHELAILTPLLQLSTQIQRQEDLPFIAQYLISSLDFSEERALRVSASPNLSPIKTADRPDSIVRFFKDNGLTDKEVKSLISWNPLLLCSNVEKILKPRASELMAAGFGGNTLIQLIKNAPWALTRTTTLSGLRFWRSFVGNNYEVLIEIIKKNSSLMSLDVNKKIVPTLNILREYGLSDRQIGHVGSRTKNFIVRDLDDIKALLERTENFGFQRGSGMFIRGLIVIASLNKDTIQRKFKFFKNTYNWSEEDVNLAIKKHPSILLVSEEKIKSIMDFFVMEFGFDPRIAVSRPVILSLSLKKRLIPRHYVLNVLKSKGLKINCSLNSLTDIPEKKFVEKFIVAYKDEVPELEDSYADLRGRKMP